MSPNFQALLILPFISVLALLMSTPIFMHTHLHVPLIDDSSTEAAAEMSNVVRGHTDVTSALGGGMGVTKKQIKIGRLCDFFTLYQN